MSASEHTEHYNLPVYKGDDKINVLVDANGAMRTIDSCLFDLSTQVSTDGENIESVTELANTTKERVDTNESAIDTLDTRQTSTESQVATMVSSYNELTTRVDNIDNSVDTILEKAESADTKADNAQTTANSADSKADTAVSTANAAKSTAESASSSASSASSAASDAMDRANDAYSLAGTALTQASEAGNKAIEAYNLAVLPAVMKSGLTSSLITGKTSTLYNDVYGTIGVVTIQRNWLMSFELGLNSISEALTEGVMFTLGMKVEVLTAASDAVGYVIAENYKTLAWGHGDYNDGKPFVSSPVVAIKASTAAPVHVRISGVWMVDHDMTERFCTLQGRWLYWS